MFPFRCSDIHNWLLSTSWSLKIVYAIVITPFLTSCSSSIKESHFLHDNSFRDSFTGLLLYLCYFIVTLRLQCAGELIKTFFSPLPDNYCSSHSTRTSLLSYVFHLARTSHLLSSHRQAMPYPEYVILFDDIIRIQLQIMRMVSPSMYFDLVSDAVVLLISRPLRTICIDRKNTNVSSPPVYSGLHLYLVLWNQ